MNVMIILSNLIENIETVYYRCSNCESLLCPKTTLLSKESIQTTLAPSTNFADTLKSAILSLYLHQIYEPLLIKLRIKCALSVYIIPTKSKIYNMIRENRGSINHASNKNNEQRKTIFQKVLVWGYPRQIPPIYDTDNRRVSLFNEI
ncbi:LOW QUALITY PROTEIN: hypothetical protein HZS_4662 [Henneguya salminicola]|nr:LOW QUALITY PROTEIN: hypothetical protein HZS_4662 [Henneguya salminicola]